MERETHSVDEESWVREQRDRVLAYLRREGVKHGEVNEWPAWHVAPCLAIWAVESLRAPGRMGWWAISGDVPTDYVSFGEVDEPRAVLRHFARQWAEAAGCLLRGEAPSEISFGPPEQWPALGDLLQRRARLLRQFADDESVWATGEA